MRAFLWLYNLVAGAGFEPAAFRLWAWRATGLLHPATRGFIEDKNGTIPKMAVTFLIVFFFAFFWDCERFSFYALSRPGSDLLSRALRQSTISAGTFHGRVRDGIGCRRSAITTRSAKSIERGETGNLLILRMNRGNGNDQAYRTISISKLHMLPYFHTWPINVVVYHGSQGILVFRWVSRLDAFSGYPVRI